MEKTKMGKRINCNKWGDFEEKGSSATSNLCHGGIFEGEKFPTCHLREECKKATPPRRTEFFAPPRQINYTTVRETLMEYFPAGDYDSGIVQNVLEECCNAAPRLAAKHPLTVASVVHAMLLTGTSAAMPYRDMPSMLGKLMELEVQCRQLSGGPWVVLPPYRG